MADRRTPGAPIGSSPGLEQELSRRALDPPRTTGRGDLTLCPCCGRDRVYPVDWALAAPGRWNLDLRCPECEWRGCGIYEQALVDRFDEALDEGMQSVLGDLEQLARANMEEQTERFIAALHAGAILPEDF